MHGGTQSSAADRKRQHDRLQQLINDTCARVYAEVEAITASYCKDFETRYEDFAGEDQDVSKRLANLDLGLYTLRIQLDRAPQVSVTGLLPIRMASFPEMYLHQLQSKVQTIAEIGVSNYLYRVLEILYSRHLPSQLPAYVGSHSLPSSNAKPSKQQLLELAHNAEVNSEEISANLLPMIPNDESRYSISRPLLEKHRVSVFQNGEYNKTGYLDHFTKAFN